MATTLSPQPGQAITQENWAPSVVKTGDWVTGLCVTTCCAYTGRVTEVRGPVRAPDCGGYRYKLADTGQFYSNGWPIEPIVFAETWASAATAQCPAASEGHADD